MIFETKKHKKINWKALRTVALATEVFVLIFGMLLGGFAGQLKAKPVFADNSSSSSDCTVAKNGDWLEPTPVSANIITGGRTLTYNEKMNAVTADENKGYGSADPAGNGVDIHFKETVYPPGNSGDTHGVGYADNSKLTAYIQILLIDPNGKKTDITKNAFDHGAQYFQYVDTGGIFSSPSYEPISNPGPDSNGHYVFDYVYNTDTIISVPFKFVYFGITSAPAQNQNYQLEVDFVATKFQLTQTFSPGEYGSTNISCEQDFSPPIQIKNIGAAALTLSTAAVPNQGGSGGSSQALQSTANPNDSNFSALGTFLSDVFDFIFGILINILVKVFGVLANIIAAVLAIYPHQADFAGVIFASWVAVRNISNIFFMLALLMLGLGTMFRSDKFGSKGLLGTIIVMALLTNFSLVIGRAILGVADTLQAQFLPANSHVIERLGAALMQGGYLNATYNYTVSSIAGSMASVINNFLYLFMALFSFMAFVAIAVLLVVRLVALWLLLLTSPIAYAGRVLTYTKNYASMWWKKFLQYAFFTPILGFGLHLCALFADNQGTYLNNSLTNQLAQNQVVKIGDFGQFLFNILSGVTILACLFMVMKVANTFGIAGANAITKHTTDKVTDLARKTGTGARKMAGKPLGIAKLQGKNFLARGRDKWQGKLLRDKEGNMRTGAAGIAGRAVHRIFNPNAYLESVERDLKNEREGLQKVSKARIEAGRTFGQTSLGRFKQTAGIDNRADLREKESQRDEVVKTMMTMRPEKVGEYLRALGKNGKLSASEDMLKEIIPAMIKSGQDEKVWRDIINKGETDPAKMVIKPNETLTPTMINNGLQELAGDDKGALEIIKKSCSDIGKKEVNLMAIIMGITDKAEADAELAKYVMSMDSDKLKELRDKRVKGIVTEGGFDNTFAAAKQRADDMSASDQNKLDEHGRKFFGLPPKKKKGQP